MPKSIPRLSHAAFLDRSDDSVHVGQAAFVVLRVVDALCPERRETDIPDMFRYQWHAADQFLSEVTDDPDDETAYLRSILNDARVLQDQQDEFTWSNIDTALSAYAINRRDRERYDEALDLHDTAWLLARGTTREAHAAAGIGKLLVYAGKLDDARQWYAWIARGTLRDRNLIAGLGRADILLAQGDGPRAEAAYQRVLRAAQRASYEAVAVDAEAGIVRAMLAQSRAVRAVPAAAALRARYHAVGDLLLARALEAIGAFDAATRLYGAAALGCPQSDERWRSVAALVRCAAVRGDRLSFARWRKVGEACHEEGLRPLSAELDFWIALTRGAMWFGARELTERALAFARDIGERAAAPDARVRVTNLEADLSSRLAPPPLPAIPADPAIRTIVGEIEALPPA